MEQLLSDQDDFMPWVRGKVFNEKYNECCMCGEPLRLIGQNDHGELVYHCTFCGCDHRAIERARKGEKFTIDEDDRRPAHRKFT